MKRTIVLATLFFSLFTCASCKTSIEKGTAPGLKNTVAVKEGVGPLEIIEKERLFDAETGVNPFTGAAKSRFAEAPDGSMALEIDYPKYKEGMTEWPAAFLARKIDLSGWDYIVVTLYNPYDENLDVGFCGRGDGQYSVHYLWPAGKWHSKAIRVEEIANASGMKLDNLDLFMTRPGSDLHAYLKSIELHRHSADAGTRMPSRLEITGFEESEDRHAYLVADAASCEITSEAAYAGTRAMKLCRAGKGASLAYLPPLDGRVGADLRMYPNFAFAVRKDGDGDAAVRLRVYGAGNEVSEFTYNYGRGSRQLVEVFDFIQNNVDPKCISRIELGAAEIGGDAGICIDNVALLARNRSNVSDNLRPFSYVFADGFEKKLDFLDDAGKKEARAFAGRIERAYRNTEKGVSSVSYGELHDMSVLKEDIEAWAARSTRDMTFGDLYRLSKAQFPDGSVGICIADSMTKVSIKDVPLKDVSVQASARLSLARNEYESFQVVILGGDAETEVSLEAGDFSNGEYRLPGNAVSISLVGHVLTKKPPYKVSHVGWWPDPILDFMQGSAVKKGEAVSFWIRFHAPKDARPGKYAGTVSVREKGEKIAEVPVELTVYDFEVPDGAPYPVAMDYRDNIRGVWGLAPRGEKPEDDAKYKAIANSSVYFLADYKIGIDNIYRQIRPEPEKMSIPVAHLKNLRDKGMLRCFNIGYVYTPRDCTRVDDPRLREVIDNALRALDYWVPVLRREGLLEYAYIYCYDELPPKLFPVMAKACREIKARYPDIPILTTCYDHSFGTDSMLKGLVDIYTPLTPKFNPDMVSKARAQGRKVWWYICIEPKNPYANWLIEYNAIEARLLMGAMAAKYRPDGFLYYAITRWPLNKSYIKTGPYTDWNPASYKTANGDGSLFCAGPDGLLPTIRSENFRDGMEDFWYYEILRGLLEKGGPGLDANLVEEANKALTISYGLKLKDGDRNPALLRSRRDAVARTIEKILIPVNAGQ